MSIIDSDTRPFWKGTLEEKLIIQHCYHCNQYQFYPRVICRNCMEDVDWVQVSGEGTIYSFTIIEKAFNKYFSEKTPYIVALIDLKEGPRIMSNIINTDINQVKIDLPVKAVFNEKYGEYKLLQFQMD